jgi:transcriptional regulator with XRE-family HTH domain
MTKTIVKQVAVYRQKHSCTQVALVNRLTISRLAVSHVEINLTIHAVRTITLLAGSIKLSP